MSENKGIIEQVLEFEDDAKPEIAPQFRGMSDFRYDQNPLEFAFAVAWQAQNHNMNRPTLAYLMDEGNRGEAVLSERDWLVASTIIQWLGSPVGESFLHDILLSRFGRHFREALVKEGLIRDLKGMPESEAKQIAKSFSDMLEGSKIAQNRREGPQLHKDSRFCSFCLTDRLRQSGLRCDIEVDEE
jgi:hypothetical protein